MAHDAAAVLSKIYEGPLQEADLAVIRGLFPADCDANITTRVGELLRRFSVLLEVNKRVSESRRLDDLLPGLVDVVCTALGADRATLFLHDDGSDELFSRVVKGDQVREIRIPDDAGIAGWVYRNHDVVIIPDAYADSRFNRVVDKRTGYRTRDILAVPLRTRDGATIGVAQVLNKLDGVFSDEDGKLLAAITTAAASALEQAALVERIEKARRDETHFLEVCCAISSDLDLDMLLQKVVQATTTLLEAKRSTLFIYDPANNELWSRVAEGLDSREIRIPADAGIAGRAFTTGEVLNIPNARLDPRFNTEVDEKTGFFTRSILCMPVINKLGESVAVMQVLNKLGGPFTEQDEARLKAFCAQLAIALENARLFRDILELKNYNEGILKSLTNGVITFDRNAVITKANDAAQNILGHEAAELVGRPAEQVFGNSNQWLIRSLDYVLASGREDYHSDTDLLRDAGDVTSVNVTAAPLQSVEGEPIGAMLVLDDITHEKRFRSTMARYLAKEVVDHLIESGGEALLGAAQEATVLFSDIREFTSIAESIGPRDTVSLLNEYFTEMVEVVLRHGGFLDKYIGDAIMAVFGAPMVDPHDADNAITVAIEMIQDLRRFNARRAEQDLAPIAIGIGISTGEVVAGSIGSTKRMDYTVIGDSVNLAARLESANKFFGTSILISGTTTRQMSLRRPLREIDLIRVKGRSNPIPVYEPLEYHPDGRREALIAVKGVFEEGLRLYRRRRWQEAATRFETVLAACRDDGPATLYLSRCAYCAETPPGDGWDGVWTMTEK